MQIRRLLQIISCIFILTVFSGCGVTFRSEIRGRLIDAETEKSVEGAVFAIYWFQINGCCMGITIGDSSGYQKIEVADGFTNADGSFVIPKYTDSFLPPTFYRLAVYKKGYAVWDSDRILKWDIYEQVREHGKNAEYSFPRNFDLKNGMVIRLEPWKGKYYIEGHSYYLGSLRTFLDSSLFSATVWSECYPFPKKNK